jgi:hypothetical protein
METLTRLVSESLARHGFDRPVDYRRLQWSPWLRCESLQSFLSVPSKPGVFALAEESMDLGSAQALNGAEVSGGAALQRCDSSPLMKTALAAEGRRMLSVRQFREAEDMAYVLDRILSRQNFAKTFVRFVVIEDETQRHGTCSALNHWLVSTGEKATGIGAHFASLLEQGLENTEVA